MFTSANHQNDKPYLIVGLGNPGRNFKNNRHNVGFLLLNILADMLTVGFTRMQFNTLVTKAKYNETTLILAKPQTYMNLSGNSTASLIRFYKIPEPNLLVAYDDADLPLGSIRLRPEGGSGGHKGMESVIEKLGTKNFPRIRIGIDRPPGRMETSDYVLQDFSEDEKEVIVPTLSRASEAILLFAAEGITTAMNRFNPIED